MRLTTEFIQQLILTLTPDEQEKIFSELVKTIANDKLDMIEQLKEEINWLRQANAKLIEYNEWLFKKYDKEYRKSDTHKLMLLRVDYNELEKENIRLRRKNEHLKEENKQLKFNSLFRKSVPTAP